jgi:uncharacterized membrane protein YeaQ/YmgE (transglycosylase-associated protein family)
MLSLALWGLFGAIVAWLASPITGGGGETSPEAFRNVLVGAAGGVLGGFLFRWDAFPSVLRIGSMFMAVVGALALATVAGWLTKAR